MLEDAYDDFQHMTNGSLRGLLNLKLDDVITLIDDDKFGGTENELGMLLDILISIPCRRKC